MRVNSNTWSPGDEYLFNNSRKGCKAVIWILGVDPTFYCPTVLTNLLLTELNLTSCCNNNLLSHQIYTCYHFCNWMLYLKTRINLVEIKILVCVHKKLYCSRINISYGVHNLDSGLGHFLS